MMSRDNELLQLFNCDTIQNAWWDLIYKAMKYWKCNIKWG